ncbi:MAG: hypothetical protein K2H59_07400 [Muribaculaceae bacterium]|nr:hypothetical protein [Muribaculaceae bacterium]
MKKLYVYADFDWLDTPKLIGELSCDSIRGSETYSFSYDKDALLSVSLKIINFALSLYF